MTINPTVVDGVRPLWSDGQLTIAYHRGTISALHPWLCMTLWKVALPARSGVFALANKLRFARRVLRAEPTDAIKGICGGVFINHRSTIWRLDLDERKIVQDFAIPDGRNALALCDLRGIDGFSDGVCFGEYFDNPAKAPVRIWQRQSDSAQWKAANIFAAGEIDHVHTIVPDLYRQCVWVLTGDFEQGAALWQARDNFRVLTPVVRGEQLYRATWLYPTADALYYATDTQLQQNYLCRLHQSSADGQWSVDTVRPIPGSSIYGAPIGKDFLFSTAVEPGMPSGRLLPDLLDRTPGQGINGTAAHIFRLNATGECTALISAEKDIWPLRLMQFGTFHLCTAPAIGAYAYGVAVVNYDGKAVLIPE